MKECLMSSTEVKKMEKKAMEPNEFFDRLTYDLAKSYEAEGIKDLPKPSRKTGETKERPLPGLPDARHIS